MTQEMQIFGNVLKVRNQSDRLLSESLRDTALTIDAFFTAVDELSEGGTEDVKANCKIFNSLFKGEKTSVLVLGDKGAEMIKVHTLEVGHKRHVYIVLNSQYHLLFDSIDNRRILGIALETIAAVEETVEQSIAVADNGEFMKRDEFNALVKELS
ncbi:MAG: hypothetical protein AAB917_03310 [Patescibacteria group bacterium]